MFWKKKEKQVPISANHSFKLWLEKNQDPKNMFPPALPAQQAIDFLMYYLLGEDYYVTDPISNEQCNTIIVNDILRKFSKEYVKECEL